MLAREMLARAMLARFNKGRPLPKEMKERIESYFFYYWENDKNYATKSETDKRFIAELPKNIRVNVSLGLYLLIKTYLIDLQGLLVQ